MTSGSVIKSPDEWARYVSVEETKDGNEGVMRIYDAFSGAGALELTYSWKHTGDVFDFVMTTNDYDTKISINTKTKAGSVEYTYGGNRAFTMTWDAAGNGQWVEYNGDGTVYESGGWEV